ncbi:hypothetical protein Ciccas_003968 [Cichlidogyrus casuarinus]|uniref:Protein kinase domain-containing protein n=1 Tax=Cichlidogyrus casuarinus TaxID=1844966 RepID=A0ABD2QCW5_9PLAT
MYDVSFLSSIIPYIVMEYIPFGELFHLWKQIKHFSESLCRFYLANIAITLDYVNKQSIIFRDLKMENLIVDAFGYLKLVDFGLSKSVKNVPHARAFTICGTLQYTSPEMLSSRGYSYSSDWWSLGILAHIMYFGSYPVQPNDKMNTNQMYSQIIAHDYAQIGPPELRNMLAHLLNKDPYKRTSLSTHMASMEFFKNKIDFDAVLRRQVSAYTIER